MTAAARYRVPRGHLRVQTLTLSIFGISPAAIGNPPDALTTASLFKRVCTNVRTPHVPAAYTI